MSYKTYHIPTIGIQYLGDPIQEHEVSTVNEVADRITEVYNTVYGSGGKIIAEHRVELNNYYIGRDFTSQQEHLFLVAEFDDE